MTKIWKKLGRGSYTHTNGKVIKAGKTLTCPESDIPTAFRSSFELVEEIVLKEKEVDKVPKKMPAKKKARKKLPTQRKSKYGEPLDPPLKEE